MCVTERTNDGKPGCQKVNFRFMGLFETVLSTNFSHQSYLLGFHLRLAAWHKLWLLTNTGAVM